MKDLRLKRLFASVTGGSWGSDAGAGEIDAKCIRGTDFDATRFRVNLAKAPVRGFTRAEFRAKRALPGDLIIEKSGGGELQPVGRAVIWDGPEPVMPTNFAARLRVCEEIDPRFATYLLASMWVDGRMRTAIKQTTGIQNLDLAALLDLRICCPSYCDQKAIADFLDVETNQIHAFVSKQRRIVDLLNEEIDALISLRIGQSALAKAMDPKRLSAPIRRSLVKATRPARPGDEMVTAFRDGQVTARSLRRIDGFTEAASDDADIQGVSQGDVVIHGLDGFAGAIGVAEVSGVCSPVYHVCAPAPGADADYLARMLRILALSGYFELFATSTRERAVDLRNWKLFRDIPIPVVPIDEQRRVGDKIRQMRSLTAAVARSIGLATEHQQALIAETLGRTRGASQ